MLGTGSLSRAKRNATKRYTFNSTSGSALAMKTMSPPGRPARLSELGGVGVERQPHPVDEAVADGENQEIEVQVQVSRAVAEPEAEAKGQHHCTGHDREDKQDHYRHGHRLPPLEPARRRQG